MLKEENGVYYRTCDDCGSIKELGKSGYRQALKKEKHYCLSCSQKGERNHRHGVESWNKGLTKETDERVKQYGEQGSKTKKGCTPWNKGLSKETDERVRKYCETQSINKKGIPNLKRRVRTFRDKSFGYVRKLIKVKLYPVWVKPILERDNFQCTICGAKAPLEVHHTYPFRKIFFEAIDELSLNPNEYMEWTAEEIASLEEVIINKHTLDIGITLCKDCHCKVDKYRKHFKTKEN